MSRTTLFWLALCVACFALAGCTMAEAASATAAVGASAAAIAKAVSPLLSPEQAAALDLTAARIDGTVEATAGAGRTIAGTIHDLRQAWEAAQAAQQAQIAALPTTTDVWTISGTSAGGAASGLNAYRSATRGKALEKLPRA